MIIEAHNLASQPLYTKTNVVCFVYFFLHVVGLQRKSIVTGTVEPTDEECEWQSESDHEDEELAVSIRTVQHILHLNRHDVSQPLHVVSHCRTGVVYTRAERSLLYSRYNKHNEQIYVLTAHVTTVYRYQPGRHRGELGSRRHALKIAT